MLRAVVAIEEVPTMKYTTAGVRAFHVRNFGVPQCVTDATVGQIDRDLRWLFERDYLERPGPARYSSTAAGREWLDA